MLQINVFGCVSDRWTLSDVLVTVRLLSDVLVTVRRFQMC